MKDIEILRLRFREWCEEDFVFVVQFFVDFFVVYYLGGEKFVEEIW